MTSLRRSLGLVPALVLVAAANLSGADAYQARVDSVRELPGLVAFWDFVLREDGASGTGRFLAHTVPGDSHRYLLEPKNISREFWRDGPDATLADFPLLGRGPFGQAVQFQAQKTESILPVLMVPRAAMHDTPLDIKGPGQSVSLVVWLNHQEGTHALAGIWHEGTLAPPRGKALPAVVREKGRRQFALFAGLAANPGAIGAHLSDNGLASFGDLYARHLAATREKMPSVSSTAPPAELDANWSVAGLVFDSAKKTVTAYLNGVATEYWIDAPAKTRFFAPAARAWQQTKLAQLPGLQPGEDPAFPPDQFYAPPETTPLREDIVAESGDERTVVRTYDYTKVRVTLRKDAQGTFTATGLGELVALKANPYWFGHDIYAPRSPEEGGPFTIGRVIHSSRQSILAAYIGGVAVFSRALSGSEMAQLAELGRSTASPVFAHPSPL